MAFDFEIRSDIMMNNIMTNHTEQIMPDQPPEDDMGNREYKLKINPARHQDHAYRCQKLATQLKYRLIEGDGRALYMLGVKDCGKAEGIDVDDLLTTLYVIFKMCIIIEDSIVNSIRFYKGTKGHIAAVRISNPKLTF
jgi:GTPase